MQTYGRTRGALRTLPSEISQSPKDTNSTTQGALGTLCPVKEAITRGHTLGTLCPVKEAITGGHRPCDSTRMRSLESSNSETEGGVGGRGGGGNGSVFTADRVPVWDDGRFWKWVVEMLTQHCERT